MDKVAIGRVVLTNREHIIALEPMEKGLVGTLLRYPYEVRSEQEYFDEIQDVKVTKDMLDLARHIVNQKDGYLRSREIRGSLRDRAGRPDQSEARRQDYPAEGAAEGRERGRPDGGAAAERRPGGYACEGSKAHQEAAQGGGGPERDVDADPRQEAGEGSSGEETRDGPAAEVGLSG
jgi:DNA end-binding protein Ku